MIISLIEKLSFGESLLVLLLGMAVILAALGLLVGLLYIIKYAVRGMENMPKKSDKTVKEQRAESGEKSTEITEDEETVAAITAAITVIMAQKTEDDDIVVPPFKIKKIKHIR